MYKLLISLKKEFLLLKRDIGGLVILFLMPLILVITITIIQDKTYRTTNENQIPILLIDNDHDSLSAHIKKQLSEAQIFSVVSQINQKDVTEVEANTLVLQGRYQMAIVIPAHLTQNLNEHISQNVEGILSQFGLEEEDVIEDEKPIEPKKSVTQEIKFYFDPTTQQSIKETVKNTINKIISNIETQTIYTAFQEELGTEEGSISQDPVIVFKEADVTHNEKDIKPNSVQHNVPAWTLFAIFFIVIPLSINIVKEKSQGTFIRLRTSPINFFHIIGGKIILYLLVCLFQFILMLWVGYFVFPYLDLPPLIINGNYFLLFMVALFSGLAAIGYGILLGTLAHTQEQAAPFGATSVVILAAIGGVWIPVFLMPKFLQIIAKSSPMNWGLNGFYDIILRDGSFLDILPEISLLFLFFVILLLISFLYNRSKSNF